ncbi:MAG TPA: glycosyl hydrolase [Clostridiales bacterium]|nr:glycosyl hydrolase [Clostridiales bacterium]
MEHQKVNGRKQTAEKILKDLSLLEKASLLSQIVWETTEIHHMHGELDKFLLADGPAGIRRLKEYFDKDIYNTKPSTCYPSPGTYASSWNRELLFELGQHMGREARQEEVDTVLAPAVNIKRNPLGGRNFEYYSEDPYLTGELATEFIKGIQREGIGACLKHFAANNQETRRMNICAEIDEETLHEVYLTAFEKPVREGCPRMVMAAYNQVNGEYCASNPMLFGILRKKWGYEGVVVTDCYAAHDLEKGLRHGLTLQMPGESGARIGERVLELVNAGQITEAELDAAVLRNIEMALEAKANRVQGYEYDREKHHAFARRIAEESMVLLKNDGRLLPLKKEEHILVTGELAVNPRFQGGGSSHVNPWKLEIPLEELKKLGTHVGYLQGYRIGGSRAENEMLHQEVLDAAGGYDKIVVFAGIPELIESEGYDRSSIQLPQEQNDLITMLTEQGQRVAVVLANGSVIEMPWREQVPAILESYLGGEAGGSAAAAILFGKVNPSGKLAETFPICLEDNPSHLYFPGNTSTVVYGEGRFVGYKYYDALHKPVAFPFGHGLSYTEFEYQKADTLVDKERLQVRLMLRNSGSQEGKETVQVYVQRKVHQESIYPKKLAGFKKVCLKPGEEQEICIPLDARTFMHYRTDCQEWNMGNGTYEFLVGSSMQDIRLEERVIIGEVPYQISEDSTIGDMIRVPGMYEKLEEAFKNHPVSLEFLRMTRDEDPLKAISMGSLMTLRTLKRTDGTLLDSDIEEIVRWINGQNN